MVHAIPAPTAPERFPPPDRVPPHFPLAQLLTSSSGKVPFADVAFDVGSADRGGCEGRYLAHRVVVGAQSPVLLEAFERLRVEYLPEDDVKACVVRVDCRISKVVWRCALQFMYTGIIDCPFDQDVNAMVELLRACTMYKLPKPLLNYAQPIIFQLLQQSSPMVAYQAFTITMGVNDKDLDVRPTREISAHILLRKAHQVFADIELAEVAKVPEKIVQTVEEAVFNPVQSNSQQQGTMHQQQGWGQYTSGYPATGGHANYSAMQHAQGSGRAYSDWRL